MKKAFSGLAETIFERYKKSIDALIAQRCGDALEHIPSISDRLAEGDREAVSHALTSCRRMIDSFADAVYPPADTTIEIDGEQVPLDGQNPRARILAFVRDHTESEHTRKKTAPVIEQPLRARECWSSRRCDD